MSKQIHHLLKMSPQAAPGAARGDRVRDLAEAGPEDFRGTSARLDWVSTWQGHRDLLLQDSKVPAAVHCSEFTGVLSGTALRMSWCLSLPLWGSFTS